MNSEIYQRFFGPQAVTINPLAQRDAGEQSIYLRFFEIPSDAADVGQAQQPVIREQKEEAVEQPIAPAYKATKQAVKETAAKTAAKESVEPVVDAAPVEESPESWYQRIRYGLSKTRNSLSGGLATLLMGKKKIDEDLLEEIETQLLMADVGVEATQRIIGVLTDKLSRSELKDADALFEALQAEMRSIITVEPENPLESLGRAKQSPFVILVIGVNGVGKTTTIGKLANRYKAQGLSVMLAAGDTFRAAAVEQLKMWGERNDVPVVAQQTGSDSASVIYDALSSAKAKNVDVLIADTAGRLHTKSNLMNELSKVKRVMGKLDESAPHEVLLVLDAGTGQNALAQAQQFHEAVEVSGIVLTKLDGTAKGGILFAICHKLGLPMRYIGVGEQAADLRPFKPDDFITALFDRAED